VTDRQILDAYRRSKSADAVARRLGVSKTTVLRVVRDHRAGRGPRSTVYTPATLRKLAQSRREGVSAVALAERYGGSVVTILTALRKAGVKPSTVKFSPNCRNVKSCRFSSSSQQW
jgi:transcriptional regulator with XRE-family HTH domain